MSGGTFDYQQYYLDEIIDDIERIINKNNTIDKYGFKQEYRADTIEQFKVGIATLKKARIYVQRIDWLHAGDDAEDNFHIRLKQELGVKE